MKIILFVLILSLHNYTLAQVCTDTTFRHLTSIAKTTLVDTLIHISKQKLGFSSQDTPFVILNISLAHRNIKTIYGTAGSIYEDAEDIQDSCFNALLIKQLQNNYSNSIFINYCEKISFLGLKQQNQELINEFRNPKTLTIHIQDPIGGWGILDVFLDPAQGLFSGSYRMEKLVLHIPITYATLEHTSGAVVSFSLEKDANFRLVFESIVVQEFPISQR